MDGETFKLNYKIVKRKSIYLFLIDFIVVRALLFIGHITAGMYVNIFCKFFRSLFNIASELGIFQRVAVYSRNILKNRNCPQFFEGKVFEWISYYRVQTYGLRHTIFCSSFCMIFVTPATNFSFCKYKSIFFFYKKMLGNELIFTLKIKLGLQRFPLYT